MGCLAGKYNRFGGKNAQMNDSLGKKHKRKRPWQREGFTSKKEWATMRKRINNLIWKNREVA